MMLANRSLRLKGLAYAGAATPAATTQVIKMFIDRFMFQIPTILPGHPVLPLPASAREPNVRHA
ncbi:MAG: hypothetical protein K9G60_13360 [Pseudolabrys sp.]|nr:hypothetical protein [Pseudolabrys sp.]